MTTTGPSPAERLLDVASRLFYAEGIHAVGIDRVIAAASVAKATLYAHFPSKAELVAAYLARESREWIDAAERRLTTAPAGSAEAVLALFDLLYDDSRSADYRGCPFINAAAEFPGPGPVATEISHHRERLRAVFAEAGGPLLASPGRLDALLALYGGAMSAAHLDHDPEIVRHAAGAAAQLLRTEQPATTRSA
ncbi:MAG: TetR/AcrR family transcriptional regulator [Acidobacteriota bacterium]|nr:TetR/AcrR family transcriptional regulator [Acidobacteriota bacterium]